MWGNGRSLARFEAERVCEKVVTGSYSVFMAVPTIYVKLIAYLKTLDAAEQIRLRKDLLLCG